MKRALARRWAAALESGEYQQTSGRLRDKDGWCCLGVLCNLHAQEHPEIAAQQEEPTEYCGKDEFPPELVWKDWAGMRGEDGEYVDDLDDLRYLSGLNDDGVSFKEIAKVIRKHWKEL